MTVNTGPHPDVTAVEPDPALIALYADVVFGYCERWVPVRALSEKGAADAPPHTPFLATDVDLAARLASQATWAADAGMALFVVPGTVESPGEARAEHIAQTQVVLVDLDHGDIAAKREHLLRHLGMPTLEVASGGVTPDGQRKLHLYWRLTEPAEDEDIARVCRARHMIATRRDHPARADLRLGALDRRGRAEARLVARRPRPVEADQRRTRLRPHDGLAAMAAGSDEDRLPPECAVTPMCCNTFPFDICNMIVLSGGQDGESSPEGQLSPSRIIHPAWLPGGCPGSSRSPERRPDRKQDGGARSRTQRTVVPARLVTGWPMQTFSASGQATDFMVPSCCLTYAGGRGAQVRQRQGRFFGKPPGSGVQLPR
jgi:hypothetical protein